MNDHVWTKDSVLSQSRHPDGPEITFENPTTTMRVILPTTCHALEAFPAPHAVTYTSEAACQNYCERLQRQMPDPNGEELAKIAPYTMKLLQSYDMQKKASIEYVDHYYASSLRALREVVSNDAIVASKDVKKIQRHIEVEIRTEVPIKRGTLALSLRGMVLQLNRRKYIKTLYNPHVRLTVHAMARFMYRAKAPPQDLIRRLGYLSSLARVLSDNDPIEGSIALAIPEGLIHGRIGHLGVNDRFVTRATIENNFDVDRMYVELKPDCEREHPSAIDLITFLPLAELNPHLRALHAALTVLQQSCTLASEIAYAAAFHSRAPTAEDMNLLYAGGEAMEAHLASDLHRTYRSRQDDREISALVQQLNRESQNLPGETAMMAAMTLARLQARETLQKGDVPDLA